MTYPFVPSYLLASHQPPTASIGAPTRNAHGTPFTPAYMNAAPKIASSTKNPATNQFVIGGADHG